MAIELVCRAVRAVGHKVLGKRLVLVCDDLFYRDAQFRT